MAPRLDRTAPSDACFTSILLPIQLFARRCELPSPLPGAHCVAPSYGLVTAPCNACWTCFLIPAQCSSAPLFCELPSASMRRGAHCVVPKLHVLGSAMRCMFHLWPVANSTASLLQVVSCPLSLRGCQLCGAVLHVVGSAEQCMFHHFPVANCSTYAPCLF